MDKMGEHSTLPAKIDRSYLRSMSGTAQTAFLTTARDFDLTDADGVPTDRLRELVYDAASRPQIISKLVHEHYAPIVELAETQATAQQLADIWRETYGQEGETRRKAITFFLQAAEYSGVSVSPYWDRNVSKTARTSSAASKSRKKSTAKRTNVTKLTESQTESHKQTVDLSGEAGKVTIEIALDPFRASTEDRNFVFSLVDMLQKYQEQYSTCGPSVSVPSEDSSEGNQGSG